MKQHPHSFAAYIDDSALPFFSHRFLQTIKRFPVGGVSHVLSCVFHAFTFIRRPHPLSSF
jgi:hypothetical protein